jgi:hypothetical protein
MDPNSWGEFSEMEQKYKRFRHVIISREIRFKRLDRLFRNMGSTESLAGDPCDVLEDIKDCQKHHPDLFEKLKSCLKKQSDFETGAASGRLRVMLPPSEHVDTVHHPEVHLPLNYPFFGGRALFASRITFYGHEAHMWEYMSERCIDKWCSFPHRWLQRIPEWLQDTWFKAISLPCDIVSDSKTHHDIADQIFAQAENAYQSLNDTTRDGLTLSNQQNHFRNSLGKKKLPVSAAGLFLFHCVREGQKNLLRFLSALPPWLSDPSHLPPVSQRPSKVAGKMSSSLQGGKSAHQDPSLEPAWVRFLLDEGGLQLILDSDAGPTGLLPTARRALFVYINDLWKAKFPSWMHSCAPDTGRLPVLRDGPALVTKYLSILLAVPEASTPTRIDAAVAAVRALCKYKVADRNRVLTDPPAGGGPSALAAALRSGREAVLSEIFGGRCSPVLALVGAPPEPPLNILARMLAAEPEPSIEHTETLHPASLGAAAKRRPRDGQGAGSQTWSRHFTLAGLEWTLTALPDISDGPAAASAVPERQGGQILIVVLMLRELPSDVTVRASVDVWRPAMGPAVKSRREEVGAESADGGEWVHEAECAFRAGGKPFFPVARIPPDGGARVRVRLLEFNGPRRYRAASERRADLTRAAQALVARGASVDDACGGHTPWSLCAVPSVPSEVRNALTPRDIPAAVRLALQRPTLNGLELDLLADMLPVCSSLGAANVSRLVGRPDLAHRTNRNAHQLLELFCDRGFDADQWRAATERALRSKDWAALDMLLACHPAAPSPLRGACVQSLAGARRASALRAALAIGADPNAVDQANDGLSALHLAARAGDEDSVRALLAAGAARDARHRSTGFTPMHEACQGSGKAGEAAGGFLGAVRALLEAGADPRARSAHRQEPLHLRPSAEIRRLLERCAAALQPCENFS